MRSSYGLPRVTTFNQITTDAELVPLIRFTSNTATMGTLTNSRLTTTAAVAAAVLLISLNAWLIVLLVTGG